MTLNRMFRVWLASHACSRDDVRGVADFTIVAGALYCWDRPAAEDDVKLVCVYGPGAWVRAEWLT